MTRTQIWFIGIYLLLLVVCGVLLLVSDGLSFTARDAILPIASEGFSLVLGALVGALSAMMGIETKKGKDNEDGK